MDIVWTEKIVQRWRGQREQGRAPHAVILLGGRGVGKRCLAAWLVRHWLSPSASAARLPQYPFSEPVHPDLHWLRPLPDKRSIGVDQVRHLVAEMSLTSHDGGGKAAVIEPANALTANAANSLLKTLEEPPGDALIVLVADRLGWLPATIFSRCQRISVLLPETQQALAWLDRLQPAASWIPALVEAGGAPLAAIDALERQEESAMLARDLDALSRRVVSPVEVANRWMKLESGQVLNWLGQQVQVCIRRGVGGERPAVAPVVADSVLQRIDSRNLFCYLDIINRLRGQAAGSYDVRLALESLLIDWADGLIYCRRDAQRMALPLMGQAR